jgi:receptor protein-tyrosine kinase
MPILEGTDNTEVLDRQEPIFVTRDDSAASWSPPPGAQQQPTGAGRKVALKFSELRRHGMITPDNVKSAISYEYRSIKRKLLAGARKNKSGDVADNLVMVTSALPREGKTFTAINLALSLAAERDLHVLLIDGDVIHPSLSTLFEPTDGKGFTDLLKGTCKNIGEVMYRCNDVANLSVIFAGKYEENTPELLSSRRMADICREISTRYSDRIIIIDTPPVLASVEPANMAMHVHQIVMVVAAGQTNRAQLEAALENVSAAGEPGRSS